MSDLFALDDRGNQEVAALARQNPFDPAQLNPGFLSGFAKGPAMGFMRGGAQAARAAGIMFVGLSAKAYQLENGLDNTDVADHFFKAVDDTTQNAVDYWTPDTGTMGFTGRVLGGFSEMALPLMLTQGNPSLLIATHETGTAIDLAKQGVDPTTAVEAGIGQGLSTAIGFKMPFLGNTLAQRMATGAAGNLAINAGTTAATAELLKARGYEDLAKNYDATNFEARLIDVLAGAAFGGMHHLSVRGQKPARKLTDAEREAIATATNARHYQSETAPGDPLDVGATVAHTDAMDAATIALLRGEPVTVPDSVTQADFAPREAGPAPELPRDLADLDAARLEAAALDGAQSPELRNIERTVVEHLDARERSLLALLDGPEAFLVRIRNDLPQLHQRVQDVAKLRDDAAALLSQDRAMLVEAEARRNAAADEKNAYAIARTREAGGGDGFVFEKWRKAAEEAVDASLATARKQLDGANSLLETMRGDIDRANRVIAADAELSFLRGARNTAASIEDRIALLPDNMRAAITRRLEAARKEAPAAPPAAKPRPAAPRKATDSAPRGPEPAKAATAAGVLPKAETFAVEPARAIAQTLKDQVGTGEFHPDGTPVMATAAEILARGDAEIARAEQDAKGIEAAVACFLQRG